MATTVRKKREVKVKEVKQELPSKLASEHLLILETMSRDLDNSRLLMAVEEQNLANLELQLRLMVDKIEKQKAIISDRARKYEAVKLKFTNTKKEIWPMYGFAENEGLGYDPISGEIKRN